MLIPVSIHANEINYISTDFTNSTEENIDQFFLQNPQKNNVILSPIIRGKVRYSFSIPREAYYISKKHLDTSDLYYLSNQIDSGLKFHSDNSKKLDMVISENNLNLILSQRILSNVNVGLFLRNNNKKSFGFNLDKDVILSQNALGNFGLEQVKGEYTVFNAKFIKLAKNENSEFFGHIDHEFKSDILNIGIGYTWFEIANQFDLSASIQEQGKKVESDLYATFGDENTKFQIGLNHKNNYSNMHLFLNLKFENTFNMKNLGTKLLLTSKDNIFGLRNLSLKSFRKKNLDMLWKQYMKY